METSTSSQTPEPKPGPGPSPSARPRLDWLRLFLEFVIVVAGISLSFWVQDLREQRVKRAEEARFLAGFRTELREDLKVIEERIVVLKRAVTGLRTVMDDEKRADLTVAELDWVMDAALTYSGFPGSLATYSELRQSGGSQLMRDKDLLGEVIHLYERDYAQAREWDSINRSFVLERMFPYIENFGPRVHGVMDGAFASGYHAVFVALEKETRFQNLLWTNATFKEGQAFVYKDLASKIERVIESLGPWPS